MIKSIWTVLLVSFALFIIEKFLVFILGNLNAETIYRNV